MTIAIRIFSAVAVYGYIRAGMNVIPKVDPLDGLMMFMAISVACITCLENVLSGSVKN